MAPPLSFRQIGVLAAFAMATSWRAAIAVPASPAAAPAPAPGGTSPSASSAGVVVAENATCRVALVAASYDDPGADDAEFLELHVEPLGGSGMHGVGASSDGESANGESANGADASVDAGAPLHDAGDAPSGPTLGDCGLTELDLIDGASGGCNTYRALPLAGVGIPLDGYVVLCPAGSSVDQRFHCDVMTAGRSALRAGWLQNGPNDGLRFVGASGRAAVDVGYEGGPACFSASAVELSTESGEIDGESTVDDVNVVCDGRFVLLGEDVVPLRAAVTCPVAVIADAGQADSSPSGTVIDVGVDGAAGTSAGEGGTETPWTPEHAPPPASHSTPSGYGPLYVDAGPSGVERPATSPPRPPGCALTKLTDSPNGTHSSRAPFAATLLAFYAFASRAARSWRRERRRTPSGETSLRD